MSIFIVVGQACTEFNQYISLAILKQLVSWVQIKQKELKSKASSGIDISPLHADSTFILHLLIRQYDSCSNIPTSGTGNRQWQLSQICHSFVI